jgi:hypothetical protein
LLSWIICSSQPLHFVYVFLTKNSTSSGCSQGRVSLALTLAKIRKPPFLSGKRDICLDLFALNVSTQKDLNKIIVFKSFRLRTLLTGR